jgi:hypothetical protein
MIVEHKRTELYDACKTIFGAQITVSDDFLRYLQPVGLKAAYRKRAFETHPDRAKTVGGHGGDMHHLFKQVRSAYEILLNYVEGRSRRVTGEPVFNGRRKQHYTPRRPQPRSTRHSANHFYKGRLPERNLLLGQYLYYSGRISWKDMIDAIVWQTGQRPKIGQLALQAGLMSSRQVVTVLSNRSDNERFAACAQRCGFISNNERVALINRQRRMQRSIGEYFVQQGLLSKKDLAQILAEQRLHNTSAFRW